MYEIKVSFAFLTAQTINCCCDENRSALASSQASEVRHQDESIHFQAVIKLLDFEKGCSRVFLADCTENAVIGDVYESLRRFEGAATANYVAYTLFSSPSGTQTHLIVSKTLSLSDSIPPALFCQQLPQRCPNTLFITRTLVVNVFVCNIDGELFVGHVPFLLPLTAGESTQSTLLASVARILCLSSECERLLGNCVVLSCSSNGRHLSMDEMYRDDWRGDQIAIIYNAVDIGDIVLVGAQWHADARSAQVPVVQGVVTRRYVQDGLMFFDIKEIDTGVVMEKLTCTQFVPL